MEKLILDLVIPVKKKTIVMALGPNESRNQELVLRFERCGYMVETFTSYEELLELFADYFLEPQLLEDVSLIIDRGFPGVDVMNMVQWIREWLPVRVVFLMGDELWQYKIYYEQKGIMILSSPKMQPRSLVRAVQSCFPLNERGKLPTMARVDPLISAFRKRI